MIHQRYPEVADKIVVALEGVNQTPALSAVRRVGRQLICVEKFDPPSWHVPSLGARPAMREPDDCGPGGTLSHKRKEGDKPDPLMLPCLHPRRTGKKWQHIWQMTSSCVRFDDVYLLCESASVEPLYKVLEKS